MSGPAQQWREALAEGRLLLQQVDGEPVFPPHATAGDAEWIEASGKGTIYSSSTVHPRPPTKPYAVVLVTLDEGPRIMSRMAADTPIGTRVTARIDTSGDAPSLLFEPAQ